MKKLNKKGFTILELVLAIAVLTIVVSTSFITLANFFSSTALDTTNSNIVHFLRKAKANSVYRLNDGSWGVYFYDGGGNGSSMTLFKGSTYSSRDQIFDDEYEIPGAVTFQNISLAGVGTEVVFEMITGETSNTGSIQIQDENSNSYSITVNSLGNIESS